MAMFFYNVIYRSKAAIFVQARLTATTFLYCFLIGVDHKVVYIVKYVPCPQRTHNLFLFF